MLDDAVGASVTATLAALLNAGLGGSPSPLPLGSNTASLLVLNHPSPEMRELLVLSARLAALELSAGALLRARTEPVRPMLALEPEPEGAASLASNSASLAGPLAAALARSFSSCLCAFWRRWWSLEFWVRAA